MSTITIEEQHTDKARAAEYGDYSEMCAAIQSLKKVMHESRNWPVMGDEYREALDLLATKVGRIITGNPHHIDSWHDIGGYARLAEKQAKKNSGSKVGSAPRRQEIMK